MIARMKNFADYYLETGNIYQSAIKAGYSENYAKTNATRLLGKDSVKQYMAERLKEIESQKIADITEVMQYLTKGMRQELEEEVVINDGLVTSIVKKKISIRDSNKCAELLAKRFGILTEKVDVSGCLPVMICGEDGLEE